MISMTEKEETMERLKIDQVSLESSDNELMEKMKQYYLSSPTSVAA